MKRADIFSIIRNELDEVEELFNKNIQSSAQLISELTGYIASSGGKRFRPALVLLSSRLCGYRGKRAITMGCVVEFIHTATLLHDDVIDNASLRRGKSSANILWGNVASVLVGDFLLAKASNLLIQDGDPEILKIVGKATESLAEGEVLELMKLKSIDASEIDYLTVIKGKTASLIQVSCEIGAILGGVRKEWREALSVYGYNIGIAFQIADDTLDYIADENVLGKRVGTDFMEGKVTLPLIHALSKVDSAERQRIASYLKKGSKGDGLPYILEILKKYHSIDYCIGLASSFSNKAKEAISIFPPSAEREAMIRIADFVVKRRS